jgi:hypothetical protein
MIDGATFIRNTNAYPEDELLKYAGQHIAWSGDGKSIVASAPTLDELYVELDRLRITDYVLDWTLTEYPGPPSRARPASN